MPNFLDVLLSAGGRGSLATMAVVDRLTRLPLSLFKRRERIPPSPEAILGNNYFRRDMGLPPVDSQGWRL